MNTVAIYAGRFQPFGPHHKRVFEWLCSKFGVDNCWISTSDHVDDRSPLTFEEKSEVIKKFGIDKIIKSASPYRLIDPRFDPAKTILFVLLGEKDEGRIQYFKKDGTPGYFKEYYGQRELEPMEKSGYVLVVPHISIKHDGNEVSGTYLRKTLPFASRSTFSDLMGWYDPEMQKLFQERFGEELGDFRESIEPLQRPPIADAPVDPPTNTPVKRHISHVYEDDSLTTDGIVQILTGLSSGKIPAYEKFDGINLKVGIKKGQVVSARNKQDILSPMSIADLKKRYADRLNLKLAFAQAHQDCEKALQSLPSAVKSYIESNNLWLNIEIVNPILDSAYKYGYDPLIIIHNLLKYDDNGRQVCRIDPLPVYNAIQQKQQSTYKIIPPNRVKLPNLPITMSQFATDIRRTKNLEDTIAKIGWVLLSKASGYLAKECVIGDRLTRVGNDVAKSNNVAHRQKYFTNLEKLPASKILPFEGIVFEWNGKLYKMTAYFKYQNQIFHLFDG